MLLGFRRQLVEDFLAMGVILALVREQVLETNPAVRPHLARRELAIIQELDQKSPARLPTPEALLERAHDIEKILAADPVRAREALRGVFENGQVAMHPGDDGTYKAMATFLPFAAIATGDLAARVGDAPVAVPFEVIVPKPQDRRKKNKRDPHRPMRTMSTVINNTWRARLTLS